MLFSQYLWGLVLAGTKTHRLKPVPLTPELKLLYDGSPMFHRKRFRLHLGSRTLQLGERTLLMGVINVTPDSFSDGGAYLDAQSAVARAIELERAGADIIDIGGESTRPGSHSIGAEEEMARLLPVLESLRGQSRIPISLDTQKADVAEAALAAGAEILNDVSGLRMDTRLGEVARAHAISADPYAHAGNAADDAARPFRARRRP